MKIAEKIVKSSSLDPNSAQTKSVDYIAMKTNQRFFSRSRFFLFFSPVLFLVFNLLYWVYFRSTNPFDHLIGKSIFGDEHTQVCEKSIYKLLMTKY